ncbi:hypothetical protein [Pontixanthobacter aquaemixtae]|uniref:PepSY domain-containing protein n=1 Tax=Pontixanthobacter aquaemixtae TaxID=1958940 RepID=A0A844ZXE0_9SPHN|nr:hypothetical protein [Pontixanthobacter aquaemixtae]MXO91902.1 hypothetical protein [Pontixanthobacter aquaemixtae]
MRNHTTSLALSLPLAFALAACSAETEDSAILDDAPEQVSTEIDPADLPEGILTVVEEKIAGMTIAEVERKEREGKVFFDVEGTRPDGSEVELDILQNDDGSFTVVEVQRDLAWADVPADARAASEGVDGMFDPVRVIESIQNDGTVIYELFADGKPEAPSAEIAVKDGEAKMLTERWEY